MDVAKLHLVLRNAHLSEKIEEALKTWDNADPAKVQRTVRWVCGLSDEFLSLATEIQDPEDVRNSLAIQYIELKSRWIALNTKVNYQTVRRGACEPEEAFRATAVSMLLGIIEPLIPQEDIDSIAEFLAQPLHKAA